MENNESTERITILKNLILRLHDGEDEETIKAEFAESFSHVSPIEIAIMERRLMDEEGLETEQIMELCNVHVSVVKDNVLTPENLPQDHEKPGHPIHVLQEENKAIDTTLTSAKIILSEYLENPSSDKLAELNSELDLLAEFDKHYTRKETSFFPIMEKLGNTAPPQVMWGVDDQIRALFKNFREALNNGEHDRAVEIFSEFEFELQEMIVKEENILIPMVMATFAEEDWVTIANEQDEIGYAIVEPTAKWPSGDATHEHTTVEVDSDRLPLGVGSLSHKELFIIMDLLPYEVTFIDKDLIVKYYNNSEGEKLLGRTPSALGRDVFKCHPPKSQAIVKQLIGDLQSGKKDSQAAWYKNSDGVYIYINYIAVRNDAGEFMGILETVQDVTELSQITGTNRDVNA